MEKSKIHQKSITLVLTHQCNLRCTYCYEKHKDGQTMPLQLAKQIVDYELNLDDGIDNVEIDLFGGEPLLEFETVRGLIDYCRGNDYPKNYIFFITTNGVLLNDERKEWLRNNTDMLQMGLSLDGTKAMHDKNRNNSFDKIDLQFFKSVYGLQAVKMTVSAETLPSLAEGVIFCHEQGFEVSCNLAYGIDWSNPNNVSLLEGQLMALIDYYLSHPGVKPCAMLDVNRLKSLSYTMEEYHRYCGAGYAMKAYDYDGQVYPCQHFLPISIGREKALQSLDIDFTNSVTDERNFTAECKTCIIRNLCPTCYGENFAATGNIHLRDMNMCRLFKVQFKALAYFAAKLFGAGMLPGSNADKAAMLKSAMLINEQLN